MVVGMEVVSVGAGGDGVRSEVGGGGVGMRTTNLGKYLAEWK